MSIKGELSFPGDKSISHRALMFAALAGGKCVIENISTGLDVESTRRCLQKCGIVSSGNADKIEVTGGTWSAPREPLDCGNSGTTVRLMLGLLAGRGIAATFVGDRSLSQRPMNRVIHPLEKMGAEVAGNEGRLPIRLTPRRLQGITYAPPVASAQVKSAVLLAGLGADGRTIVVEKTPTRDHTEILLRYLGADLVVEGNRITVKRLRQPLNNFHMTVPGDPSTAAYFAAAAALVPGSELRLRNILFNPTRYGFFIALEKMGAGLETLSENNEVGEPVGDLLITPRSLKAIHIRSAEIPSIIDELPILAVLATQAEGTTIVEGAAELRVKESDRIRAVCVNLKRMGADITEKEDGFIIHGPTPLRGCKINTFGDHRIAMSFMIAGLIAEGPVEPDNLSCIEISCPEFNAMLQKVTG
ncbi:MAG: 3-phosphoshikimate 1-carboxyvinyltransferase [FCB group bacterium]|nr:3-phosphoshikimate 1-carboxyvinyltransferase [FCB group bacterium]